MVVRFDGGDSCKVSLSWCTSGDDSMCNVPQCCSRGSAHNTRESGSCVT